MTKEKEPVNEIKATQTLSKTEETKIDTEEPKSKKTLHDKLFKEVFSNPEVTIDLFKHHLPPEIFKKIDTKNLQLTNKSFITEEYSDKHSDLVYKTKINGANGYIYTVLEHQSTNDKHMGIRLLEYNVQLMRQHMKENKTTKAPIILNILIYAGKKSYTGPHNMLEIFEKPELAKELMFREINVIDLQSSKDEEIIKDEKAGFVELLLKYGILRDFIKLFENQMEILKTIIHEIPYLDRALSYIFLVDSGKNKEKLLNLLKEATQNEKKVMTLARQFKNEGIQEGIQKGIQKGIQEGVIKTAKNMLKNGISSALVKKTTGLSNKDLETLTKKK